MQCFVPLVYAKGGYLQTYGGFLISPPFSQVNHECQWVRLTEGDQTLLRVTWPQDDAKNQPKQTIGEQGSRFKKPPVVVLFHGLGGNSESSYMLRITHKLSQKGFIAVRFNHRGCAPEAQNKARQIYHAGRTEDIDLTLEHVAQLFHGHSLLAMGFSLSANMLLAFLARNAHGQKHQSLLGALAVNPPLDLTACSTALSRPMNKPIDRYFTANLRKAAINRLTVFQKEGWSLTVQEKIAYASFSKIVSLKTFDKYYTAPLAGFDSLEDYYETSSSKSLLPQITKNCTILTALDDPIIPPKIYENIALSGSTELCLEERGGHLGYLSKNKTEFGDRRWLDAFAVDWCLRTVRKKCFT